MLRSATIVLALLLSAVAEARELKVATWDLGWLTLRDAADPDLPRGVKLYGLDDRARLRAYVTRLNADVVAIQGVDGPEAAVTVFDPAAYDVFLTGDDVVLRSGFAVRHGISARLNPDVATLGRHRLRSGADLTLDLGHGASLRLMSVHLKAGCRVLPLDGPDACATLREQGTVLRAWLDARAGDGGYAILGDFGRVLDAPADLATLLGPGAEGVLRATAGHANPCWGGGAFIDHLLFGGTARGWVTPDTLRTMVFRETDDDARARLPTHCPVSVRLRIPE